MLLSRCCPLRRGVLDSAFVSLPLQHYLPFLEKQLRRLSMRIVGVGSLLSLQVFGDIAKIQAGWIAAAGSHGGG